MAESLINLTVVCVLHRIQDLVRACRLARNVCGGITARGSSRSRSCCPVTLCGCLWTTMTSSLSYNVWEASYLYLDFAWTLWFRLRTYTACTRRVCSTYVIVFISPRKVLLPLLLARSVTISTNFDGRSVRHSVKRHITEKAQ